MNDAQGRFNPIAKDHAAKIEILGDEDAAQAPRKRQHAVVCRAACNVADIDKVRDGIEGRRR